MATPTQRPNILWYCADQQRYDTIRALGHPHIATPQLDALCAGGVAFRRAYTQSPICTPTRATFLTGRYPAAHHVHRNGNEYFPPRERFVTRMFADAGYDCGLVGKLHLSASKSFGAALHDGYRAYDWSHHPTRTSHGHEYDDGCATTRAWTRRRPTRLSGYYGLGVPAELHQTTWCSEMAMRFITQQRERPWLLTVNPFEPHAPFDAPREYLAHFNPPTSYPLFRESDIERQRDFVGIDQQTMVAVDPLRRTSGP